MKYLLGLFTPITDNDVGGLCRKPNMFHFFQGEQGTPGVKGTLGHLVNTFCHNYTIQHENKCIIVIKIIADLDWEAKSFSHFLYVVLFFFLF